MVDARRPPRGFVTKSGDVLTESDLAQLADEAEAGYDPERMHVRWRRGRPPMGSGPARIMAVRLEPELETAVRTHAADEDMTTSELIRTALRHYLDLG